MRTTLGRTAAVSVTGLIVLIGASTVAADDAATTTTEATTTTTTTEAPAPAAASGGESTPVTVPTDIHAAEPVIALGNLSIPKIGVDMTMYEGVRMSTLEYGPGHWPGTATPGQAGNVVVGGHRTSKHKVFRNVDQLDPGDQIVFTNPDGSVHTYAVSSVEIVQPTDVWIINPTETATATLFACHPPGSTAQRIVVFADLVSG